MRSGLLSRHAVTDVTRNRVQRAPRALTTMQGDEAVVLDIIGERYFTLNEVALRIWTMLAEPTTLQDIVAVLHREYDVPALDGVDILSDDVTRLLHDLHAAGLVIVHSAVRGAR